MLKSDMVKYAKRDTESIVEIGGDKSKLKYTDFHDYISLDLYNEWKWLFNNIRKIEVTTEYADNLLSKVAEATTIATDRLNEVVELRVVDMDDSVTADSIDDTLDIMTSHYDRNRDAISATSVDGDIKDKLNNYNVLMHELIVRVKKAMNESIVGMDTELFGFGKKYESDLNYTTVKEFLKGSGWIENLFDTMGKSLPIKDFDWAYDDILKKSGAIKDSIAVGVAKRSMRVVSPDSNIIDDDKHTKIMKHLDDKYAKNKEFIAGYKISDDRRAKLNRWNNEMYQSLKRIREVLKKGIKEVKSTDKESFDDNGIVTIVSDPFTYVSMDTEGFQAISGLVATGFKKVTGVISDISDMMTISKPDYTNLAKGFFSKEKRYQDIYNYLVPVPAGYSGYVKDVSLYVLNNIHQVNTLESNLDNLINSLSGYINSSEYRESFAVDMSAAKVIEAIASELYKENRKYLSESKEDSKPINKLLRSANELDDIIDNLKKADKILNLDQLESIKKKMKQVDNLVTIMIDNKSQYSKPKLLEIAKYIDAIISLSNAVGTVVYLKNSTDIILVDIKNIL